MPVQMLCSHLVIIKSSRWGRKYDQFRFHQNDSGNVGERCSTETGYHLSTGGGLKRWFDEVAALHCGNVNSCYACWEDIDAGRLPQNRRGSIFKSSPIIETWRFLYAGGIASIITQ